MIREIDEFKLYTHMDVVLGTYPGTGYLFDNQFLGLGGRSSGDGWHHVLGWAVVGV